MRVLLHGECDRFASGAWCYAETLKEMGHSVDTFKDDFAFELYRDSVVLKVCRKLARRPLNIHRTRHISALVQKVHDFRPDLLIVLKGLYLGADDIRKIRQDGVYVVNINHDDFFSTNRNNWSNIQRSALSEYDFIFATREINVQEVQPYNRKVEFFPFAWFPRIHRPVAISENERAQFESDVLFVGTWEHSRSALMEALVSNVKARYAIYGTQWNKVPAGSELRKFVRFQELLGDDMAKAIGGAKIALGFLRKENRDDYTQRTFEIPACNGVLLAERTKRHQEYYKEGAEALFFDVNSSDELCRQVSFLLSSDSARERMRTSGRQALLRQKHTYRDRMDRLLEVYHAAKGK